MARRKRRVVHAPNYPRTIERIAIAALAAVAARGSGKSLALAAVSIFFVVVIIEELGRLWFWHGKRRTLRDVAFGSIGDLRLWSADRARGGKRRKRRARSRRRRSVKAGYPCDAGTGTSPGG